MRETDLEYWLGITTFLTLQQGEKIMSAIDDLNGAVTNLLAALDGLATRVDALTVQNDPAIAAAVATVAQATDRVNALAP